MRHIWGEIAGAVVTALIGGSLTALVASRRSVVRNEHGVVMLEYGRGIRAFSIGLLVLAAGLLLVPVVSRVKPSDIRWIFMMAALFGGLGAFLSAETLGVCLLAGTDGILGVTPWRARRFVRWADVKRVDYSVNLEWLVLESEATAIRIPNLIDGRQGFAQLALERLGDETLRPLARNVLTVWSTGGSPLRR